MLTTLHFLFFFFFFSFFFAWNSALGTSRFPCKVYCSTLESAKTQIFCREFAGSLFCFSFFNGNAAIGCVTSCVCFSSAILIRTQENKHLPEVTNSPNMDHGELIWDGAAIAVGLTVKCMHIDSLKGIKLQYTSCRVAVWSELQLAPGFKARARAAGTRVNGTRAPEPGHTSTEKL